MNNFLTQFGPGGVDLKARRSPRKSQAGRTKRSASLSVTQTRIKYYSPPLALLSLQLLFPNSISGNSAPENGGGASSAPDREPRGKCSSSGGLPVKTKTKPSKTNRQG